MAGCRSCASRGTSSSRAAIAAVAAVAVSVALITAVAAGSGRHRTRTLILGGRVVAREPALTACVGRNGVVLALVLDARGEDVEQQDHGGGAEADDRDDVGSAEAEDVATGQRDDGGGRQREADDGRHQ